MAVKDRGTALEGFAALYDGTGNADAVVSQWVRCKVVLEYEMVRDWQTAMRAAGQSPTLRGKPLGLLPHVYPLDAIKGPLMKEATEFAYQIGLQGFKSDKYITSFEVWGPYAEKVGTPRDWVPEEDNPFIAKADKKTATTAWLYGGNESPIQHGCAFFIRSEFTRAARYGHEDEKEGLIVV
jgi:hypothetical protein